MAAWLIPALKAIIPHVGTIIGAAAPVFTKRTADKEADPLGLIGKQIAELQSAAAKNTGDTKELAAQLQGIVTTLEKAAVETQSRLRRTTLLSGAAIVASVCAAVWRSWLSFDDGSVRQRTRHPPAAFIARCAVSFDEVASDVSSLPGLIAV